MGLRSAPFAPWTGFAQEGVQRFLSLSYYSIGVKPGPEESSERSGPGVIEGATYTGQVTIDDRRNPDLATADGRLYPLPLTCKPLQSMNFGRRQVNLNQLFWIDEGHLGQGKRIETVALNRSAEISPQGSHFLRLGFHQPAVRVTRTQVDSHHLPWQARGFQDYGGIGAIPENTLLQDSQSFGRSLEAEAVTGLCSIVQTPRPVSSLM